MLNSLNNRLLEPAKIVLRACGVNRAIAYVIMTHGWNALAGPVTLVLIAQFMTVEEQGFYYTFASILGLRILFELGLNTVILQFASHERANLSWSPQGTLEGDKIAKARLGSLLRSSLKWYLVVGVLAACLLVPGGFWFFRGPDDLDVAWKLPWLGVALLTAANCLLSPAWAILEGCGLVTEVNKVRLVQRFSQNAVLWLALAGGWALFAGAFANTIALLYGLLWLIQDRKTMLLDLARFHHKKVALDWWGEVWPMQWKIALSWVSGWLMFHLFSPVLFKYHGAAIAGQMGMSLVLSQALLPLAGAWINTKAPLFGQLIARREYQQLDAIFFRALWQSWIIPVAGGALLCLGVYGLEIIDHPLSSRLLPPLPFTLLVIAGAANHLLFSQAVYLRAHKKEPYLALSVGFGLAMLVVAFTLGQFQGAMGMIAGYLFLTLTISLGAGTWVFMSRRRQWHGEPQP